MRHGKTFVVAVLAFALNLSVTLAGDAPWVVSKNYADVQKFMRDLVAKYPQNAELFVLGKNNAGVDIEGLKVGSGPVNNLLVATHHGNEYGSTEVAKGFAASVAAAPIQGQTLWIIPVLNIPGYNTRTRWERVGSANNDPNRDYPGPCGTDGPFNLKSTRLLADFLAEKNIVASATLHTYWPVVVYPWGISTHDLSTPYDDLFASLCKAATVESGYKTGNNTQLIYPADGTFEDYAFWKHGIWSLLFELGNSHNPSDAAVTEMIRVNVPGLRRMYEQAPRQRADQHDFTGKCDIRLKSLDRRDE
jgi:carboxypeptidase T